MSDNFVKDIRAAFSMLDTNQDGMVNAEELKSMMTRLGFTMDDSQIQDLLRQASKSGDGLISEDEFLHFMNRHSPDTAEDTVEDLLAAFRVFDKDKNGYITRDELQRAMQMIGESVTEVTLDEMIKMADVDKDGRINYEEFARMLL